MNKFTLAFIASLSLATACSSDPSQNNPKDIPVDTGAQPQSNVIVSAPPGTMGHGRF